MAITAIEYSLFSQLKQSGVLPLSPALLELGEANWYGDVPIEQLGNDIYRYVSNDDEKKQLYLALNRLVADRPPTMLWDVAKIFYRTFLNYCDTVAIDFDGTAAALKLDLNQPLDLGRQFDIVFNGGTAEHVFNQFQVFKTIHAATLPGGIMIHGLPFTGWMDHGFYNFNPTFFWDLAAANDYQILALVYAELSPLKLVQLHQREQTAEMLTSGQIGANSLIYAIFKKTSVEQPFISPLQGYYAKTVSKQVSEAWQTLR